MQSYEGLKRDVFIEINRLRANPIEFASRLEATLPSYRPNKTRIRVGSVPVLTREGASAVQETIQALRNTRPMGTLALSDGMSRAAQSHCNDTGPLGIVGHVGSRESTLQDRLESFGRWGDSIGETIDYGSITGFESVCALLIDDGLPSRPHRNIVLNSKFKKIGVGAGRHTQYNTIICCDFAGDFIEKGDMAHIAEPEGSIDKNEETDDWLDDAVKVTCEITTEEEAGRIVKTTKKFWEMSDGSIVTTEEVHTEFHRR
jgi:uncharacterized protein YkwD